MATKEVAFWTGLGLALSRALRRSARALSFCLSRECPVTATVPVEVEKSTVKLNVPLPETEAKRPVPASMFQGTTSPPLSRTSLSPLSVSVSPFFAVSTTSSLVKQVVGRPRSQPVVQSATNETRPTPETVPIPSILANTPQHPDAAAWVMLPLNVARTRAAETSVGTTAATAPAIAQSASTFRIFLHLRLLARTTQDGARPQPSGACDTHAAYPIR